MAGRYSRAQWLAAIATNRESTYPFVVAAMAYWAVVEGDEDIHPAMPPREGILWRDFLSFQEACAQYALDDPIRRTASTEANLWVTIRRISMSQVPFEQYSGSTFARAVCLWTGIAPRLSLKRKAKFDFLPCFESFYGLTPLEWIQVAYGLIAASNGNATFSRDWFDKARAGGMRVPTNDKVLTAFETLVATPSEFIALAERLRWSDRTFFAYDRNPLLRRPVVRPWEQKDIESRLDRLTAPLPLVMASRVTTGVRDDLFEKCGDPFTEFFGDVFSEYVGELLKEGYAGWQAFSEDDLERLLKAQMKRPDWLTLTGEDVILWECKAARLSQRAVVTGDVGDTAVKRHLIKAVTQFEEFESSLTERVDVEHPIRMAKRWWRVIAVWEPLYIGKSELEELVGSPMRHPTFILHAEQIEALVAVLASGESPAETFALIAENGFDSTIASILSVRGAIGEEGHLSKYDRVLTDSLGIPKEML